MPIQFHNVEVDNIWKIKRKVAKIMRANNDDDRQLSETKDMSEESDKLTIKMGELSNLLYEVVVNFNFETYKRTAPKKLSQIMDKIDLILRIVKKIDFNKMDALSIQTIKESVEKLQSLSSNYNVVLASTIKTEEEEAEYEKIKAATLAYEETEEPKEAEEPPPTRIRRGKRVDDLSTEQKRHDERMLKDRELYGKPPVKKDVKKPERYGLISWDKIFEGVEKIIEQISIKMTSYKETSAVLEGGRMIGGSLKYHPMFQTQKYY